MQEVEEDDNGERENKRESSESSEEDQQTTVWSLGKYGIFQLTDSYFCNSGYRWSRNVCHTACSGEFMQKWQTKEISWQSYFPNSDILHVINDSASLPEAFTDDDIRDDIKCFMDSKYLG